MDWRELWALISGYPAPIQHLHPIIGSLIFYTTTFIVCGSLRHLNRALSPKPLQGFIADFVSTFQTCACSLENGNSMRLYGWAGLFGVLFTLSMSYSNIFTHSCPSPVGNFKKFFMHRQSFLETAVKVALQALAGYSAFQYAKQFWSLDLHEYHHIRYNEEQCYTFLSVSIATGFLIEGGATMIDVLLDFESLSPWKQVDNVMKSSLMAAMIVSGLGLTGMFFHPAMASCQNFGCKGTQPWEHILVYWVGPLVGCFLAVALHSLIRKAAKMSDEQLAMSKQILWTNGVAHRTEGGENSHPSKGAKKKSKKLINNNNKLSKKLK